jgi:hypothetical protein
MSIPECAAIPLESYCKLPLGSLARKAISSLRAGKPSEGRCHRRRFGSAAAELRVEGLFTIVGLSVSLFPLLGGAVNDG